MHECFPKHSLLGTGWMKDKATEEGEKIYGKK